MGIFGGPRKWYLHNIDTGENLEGQFVAEDVSQDLGAVWAERHALNRQHGILQYVHGDTEVVSFRGRLYLTSELFTKINDPEEKLKVLKLWVERDPKLKRPPLLTFWIGDGHLQMSECVIESLSGISYGTPTSSGALRDVSFTVSLRRWFPYDIEFTEGSGETRYHRAKEAQYYELLAWREYGSALIGDVIRKRHPTIRTIEIGDVIKLPNADVVMTETIEPTSIPLVTAYGEKDTPQKARLAEVFDDRNVTQVSHILAEH